ncbi:MAG: 4'-phosphopantetheinyl transferase superfamily protein [Prevotella sp.]|nr:4'-phosphopantetheinyl transferase superfamily protein [Prevotella sp.]
MIYINDEPQLLPLNDALAELSEQRREQALRYKHEQGRRLCVAAYLLLKEGLLQEYGISELPLFGYHDNGKPYLADHPDIFFNLSHCRRGAICALSTSPVGVDMESIREYRQSLADYTMNADEAARIAASAQPDLAFTQLWTMKESLLKLTGQGISTDMKDVLTKAEGRVRFTTVVNRQKQYVYTVCTNREQP